MMNRLKNFIIRLTVFFKILKDFHSFIMAYNVARSHYIRTHPFDEFDERMDVEAMCLIECECSDCTYQCCGEKKMDSVCECIPF